MPTYGPRVLGDKEWKKEMLESQGGRGTYGSRVVDPVVDDVEEVVEDGVTFPLSFRATEEALAVNPDLGDAAAEAELAKDKPRKSVVKMLLDLGVSDELMDSLQDLLNDLEG